jgi:2-dehydro-3-deoxyphosphogluconate aldolase/(4S)-4-hydroxy-2-oxoglutarate aldolase
MKSMVQNNIASILDKNPLIPVVTINDEVELKTICELLIEKGIGCIEITLRTAYSKEAIRKAITTYAGQLKIGVGTVVSVADVQFCQEVGVDFMVSPGMTNELNGAMEESKLPFIMGAVTPTELMEGMERGWTYFKFFPANIFGGVQTLKTYGALFPQLKFCPTGGIKENNYKDYLKLDNVVSVGGSWLIN